MASIISSEQLQALLAALVPNSSATPDEEWLTVQEAEKRYKISRWTLRRLRIAKKIIAKKLSQSKSGKVLISKKSIDLWLAATSDAVGAQA